MKKVIFAALALALMTTPSRAVTVQESAAAAAASATAAAASKVAADNARRQAEAAVLMAKTWATWMRGEVITGQGYSAKYWANNAGNILVGPRTWSGIHTFSSAPIFTTLNGYIKGNSSLALSASATIPIADIDGDLDISRLTQGDANTVLANATSATADYSAFAMPSCSQARQALGWTTNAGFTCNSSVRNYHGIRQTTTGPVSTSGLPTLLPATNGSLSITTQNVTSTAPFTVSAAAGWDVDGSVDYLSRFTSNQTWSGLTASQTNYLYVNAQTGTFGSTILTPIYQFGGTPATTNNQFTFNIAEMKGYMGNGTTAPETHIVFVGEADTNGSTVTASRAYAYSGMYDSGFTATLATGAISKNSQLGIVQVNVLLVLECTTTDNGYAVGDRLLFSANGTSSQLTTWTGVRGNTIGFAQNTAYGATNKSTGAAVSLTAGSWKYKMVAVRWW